MWGRDSRERGSNKNSSYVTQTCSRRFYKQKQISLSLVICNSGQRAGSEIGGGSQGRVYQVRWQVTITVQITGTLVLIIPRNMECCGEIIVSGPLLPALASPSLEITWFVPVIFTLIDCFSWCGGSGSLLQSDL